MLKLAGRAVWLFFKYGIGMKKIDKSDKSEKIKQVDKKNFLDARIFHGKNYNRIIQQMSIKVTALDS